MTYRASRIIGEWWKGTRLAIKTFRSPRDRDAFLSVNPDWGTSESTLKPGVYAMWEDQWTDVRKIDPRVLAHL